MSYWVHFEDRKPGCVVKPEDAPQFGKVKDVYPLPYPAEPQLTSNDWPAFCISPETCKGCSACPRDYSCTE